MSDPDRWVLPWAILPEVDYLVETQLGAKAQAAFLADLAGGAFHVEWGQDADLEAAARICQQYNRPAHRTGRRSRHRHDGATRCLGGRHPGPPALWRDRDRRPAETAPRVMPDPAPSRRRLVLVLALLFTACSVLASPAAGQTQPTVGQEGKDVPWVPTPDVLVDKMLEMANVSPDDLVVDLGSGDGRTVIAAARLGARAIGIEFDPELVALSTERAAAAGVSDLTEFVASDLFEYDLSRATVITLFLLPDINYRLRPTLFALRPGTRIVSNTWDLSGSDEDPDAPGWTPTEPSCSTPAPPGAPRCCGSSQPRSKEPGAWERRAAARTALPGGVRQATHRGPDRPDRKRAG